MQLRERCISIQPRWSLHDSAGKWPAVIKQCGGKKKHRGIFSGNADIFFFFFAVLNFTRVNKSPKESRIKSTPQPPQFSKTPGPRGNGSPDACERAEWPADWRAARKAGTCWSLNADIRCRVWDGGAWRTGSGRQKEEKRKVLFNRSGV